MAVNKGQSKAVPFDPIQLQTLSALVGRAALAAKLGYHYSGDRDIYRALGYKTDLVYGDFATQYARQDMAKAIIDRPIQATWRGGVELLESDEEDTPLEKAFIDLNKRLGLVPRFARLDKLTGLGKYGVLFLGLSDTRDARDLRNPVQGNSLRLLYVRPFGQGSATIEEYEADPANERYGLPTLYSIEVSNVSTKGVSTLYIHHSRIIHAADGLLESEVEGTPRLEVVYNRLKDLEKLVGASAEMFWRGARPGYHGKLGENEALTPELKDNLQDIIDEYEHNIRRFLIGSFDLKSLAMQVADPANHVDVQIQMISAVTGIPKRVLTGSERGELASTEDKGSWLEVIEGRRSEFASPIVIRPFVDKGIKYGFLPPPQAAGQDYSIKWQDLWAPSDKDQAEVGRIRADALAKYTASPLASSVVPPDAFFEFFLGLDRDQIGLIAKMLAAAQVEEEEELEGEFEGPEEVEAIE